MGIQYLQADFSDIDQIIRMRLAYIRDDFGPQTPETEKLIENQLKDYFRIHLGKDCFVFEAKENETIVATAFLVIVEKPANPRFLHGKIGDVLNVYTAPEKRRQGIAGTLMRMMLDYGQKLNLDFIELKATADGYPLYKKLGFEDSLCGYKEMKYVYPE